MKDFKDLAGSAAAIRLGMVASRIFPPAMTYWASWQAAGLLVRLRPRVFRVVRANLRQVVGAEVDAQDLDQIVRQAFSTTIRGYYDLFRALRLPRDQMAGLIHFSESGLEILRSLWHREEGSLLVMPHLGNFDLAGQALAPLLPETQVLSLPEPPPGFQLTNEIREASGVMVTPLSPAALRQAIQLLRRGGTVSTAVDRPVSDLDEPVMFFGRPARLPSGPIRLALKTGAVIVQAYCVWSPEAGEYQMTIDPPLEMVRTGDRDEEVRVNMRILLDRLEPVIRRWSGQWQMYVPVWPDSPSDL